MEFKIGDYVRSRNIGIEGIIIPIPDKDLPRHERAAKPRRFRVYVIYDETYHKPGDTLHITHPDGWEVIK